MTATLTLPTHIRCPRCQATKARAEFGNNRSRANGKNSECKACQSVRIRAYRATPEGKRASYEANLRYVQKMRRAYGLDTD